MTSKPLITLVRPLSTVPKCLNIPHTQKFCTRLPPLGKSACQLGQGRHLSVSHRRYATKSTADEIVEALTEKYATAKDEFEIASEETDKKSVYAADDRQAARDELDSLKNDFEEVVKGAEGEEIRRRFRHCLELGPEKPFQGSPSTALEGFFEHPEEIRPSPDSNWGSARTPEWNTAVGAIMAPKKKKAPKKGTPNKATPKQTPKQTPKEATTQDKIPETDTPQISAPKVESPLQEEAPKTTTSKIPIPKTASSKIPFISKANQQPTTSKIPILRPETPDSEATQQSTNTNSPTKQATPKPNPGVRSPKADTPKEELALKRTPDQTLYSRFWETFGYCNTSPSKAAAQETTPTEDIPKEIPKTPTPKRGIIDMFTNVQFTEILVSENSSSRNPVPDIGSSENTCPSDSRPKRTFADMKSSGNVIPEDSPSKLNVPICVMVLPNGSPNMRCPPKPTLPGNDGSLRVVSQESTSTPKSTPKKVPSEHGPTKPELPKTEGETSLDKLFARVDNGIATQQALWASLTPIVDQFQYYLLQRPMMQLFFEALCIRLDKVEELKRRLGNCEVGDERWVFPELFEDITADEKTWTLRTGLSTKYIDFLRDLILIPESCKELIRTVPKLQTADRRPPTVYQEEVIDEGTEGNLARSDHAEKENVNEKQNASENQKATPCVSAKNSLKDKTNREVPYTIHAKKKEPPKETHKPRKDEYTGTIPITTKENPRMAKKEKAKEKTSHENTTPNPTKEKHVTRTHSPNQMHHAAWQKLIPNHHEPFTTTTNSEPKKQDLRNDEARQNQQQPNDKTGKDTSSTTKAAQETTNGALKKQARVNEKTSHKSTTTFTRTKGKNVIRVHSPNQLHDAAWQNPIPTIYYSPSATGKDPEPGKQQNVDGGGGGGKEEVYDGTATVFDPHTAFKVIDGDPTIFHRAAIDFAALLFRHKDDTDGVFGKGQYDYFAEIFPYIYGDWFDEGYSIADVIRFADTVTLGRKFPKVVGPPQCTGHDDVRDLCRARRRMVEGERRRWVEIERQREKFVDGRMEREKLETEMERVKHAETDNKEFAEKEKARDDKRVQIEERNQLIRALAAMDEKEKERQMETTVKNVEAWVASKEREEIATTTGKGGKANENEKEKEMVQHLKTITLTLRDNTTNGRIKTDPQSLGRYTRMVELFDTQIALRIELQQAKEQEQEKERRGRVANWLKTWLMSTDRAAEDQSPNAKELVRAFEGLAEVGRERLVEGIVGSTIEEYECAMERKEEEKKEKEKLLGGGR
ncbi:MAG: hypothetical protein Q9169_002636 [Polycauliona sp. 2 TL-2023]